MFRLSTEFQKMTPMVDSRKVQPAHMQTEHETVFVQTFIRRERRERWLTKLSSRKHRRSFLDRLNHQFRKDLDDRFVIDELRPWPKSIERCYMIADEREYDGRHVTTTEAADAVSSAAFGIVVSFIPGMLACYKDEAPSEIIWLERK